MRGSVRGGETKANGSSRAGEGSDARADGGAAQTNGEVKARTFTIEDQDKLVKFTELDDIEAYLTTFKRVMRAYEVKEEWWAV